MTRPGGAATPIWAVLAIIAAAIVAHASYTADLSAFLPRSPTATQQLLIEQLRSGPRPRLRHRRATGGLRGGPAGVRLEPRRDPGRRPSQRHAPHDRTPGVCGGLPRPDQGPGHAPLGAGRPARRGAAAHGVPLA